MADGVNARSGSTGGSSDNDGGPVGEGMTGGEQSPETTATDPATRRRQGGRSDDGMDEIATTTNTDPAMVDQPAEGGEAEAEE
ncbi:MAG TPA: hypothetical protein VF763_04405 [Candidatus Limnocylindrales bacterium]